MVDWEMKDFAKILPVILGASFLCALFASSGCQSKLETGYEPNKLGTLTPAERRGLYAQDFTAEAQAAQNEKKSDQDNSYRTRLPGGNAE